MGFNVLEEPNHIPNRDEYGLILEEGTDEGFKERFIYYCIENTIPQDYAQLFIDFLLEEQKSILENAKGFSEKVLHEHWGSKYQRNIHRAKQAVIALDRKMGGKLIAFFEEGYGNHPVLIEMLALVGESIEEDTVAMPTKSCNANKAMSTEEFLTKVVFK